MPYLVGKTNPFIAMRTKCAEICWNGLTLPSRMNHRIHA
eukprot:COSAG02_NODE_48783_length_331_cov_0.887931_1_plen_38_part_01